MKKICGNCNKYSGMVCDEYEKNVLYRSEACEEVFAPVWENLPEYCQSVENQKYDLENCLENLKKAQDGAFWFGDPSIGPGCRLSTGVGIRFMNTAGGEQYRLFSVNSMGQEHSSGYYTDKQQLIKDAIVRACIFCRPTRFQIRGQGMAPRPVLQWYFAGSPVRQPYSDPHAEGYLEKVMNPTITITLENK